MKKLKIMCLTLLAIVIAVLSFANYSYDAQDTIEKDKAVISIIKPNNMTNAEFLKNVSDCLFEQGIDIMYRYVDISGDKPLYLYYKTNFNENFIKCMSEKGSMLINENECISTKYQGENGYQLQVSSLFSDFTFYDWNKAEKYDLSNGYYFVETDKVNSVAAILSKQGYSVIKQENIYITGKLSVVLFTVIPVILVLITFLFYVFLTAKGNVVRKMDGYSDMAIQAEIIWCDMRSILLCLGIVEVWVWILGAILFKYSFIQFMKFHIHYLLLFVTTVLSSEILGFTILKSQNTPEHIKGKVPKNGIYHLTMLTKTVFLLFIVFFLSVAIRNIQIGINTYNTSKKLCNKMENYVCIPIYNNNASVENLDQNFLNFYLKTVDTYEGVLIDASNYEYDLISNTTLAEEFNQYTVTINRNFLTLNPIYDMTGERIMEESIQENIFYILLPADKANEDSYYMEFVKDAYKCTPQIITYDDEKTDVYSYNANTGTGNYGKLESPVIFIWPDEYITGEFVFSYCSKGSYFLKVESLEPYKELFPVLEEFGIEKIVPQTPYILSRFNDVLEQHLQMLVMYGSQAFFLAIAMVSLIFFSGKVYCENYKDVMAYQLIEGFSIQMIIRKHILYILIGYVLAFNILNCIKNIMSISVNQIIIWTFLLFDLVYTFLLCKRFTRRNLNEVIKGAE